VIDEREPRAAVAKDSAGAVLMFSGVVRDSHRGRCVRAIEYHGYRPMAEREAEKIEADIVSRWPSVSARVVHRLGMLGIGETSVVIAVSSPHRDEGFQALRHGIESVKERLPVWKKEIYVDGSEAWIEGS
jgi:molybdopterin synthase catalytic subunit